MGHYDCKECGTFGCFGECQEPANVEREKQRVERQARADKYAAILEAEERRVRDLEKARAFFLVHYKKGNPI
ncbi:hypothetical protein [Vibrio phage TCU-VP03-AIR1]